MLLYALTILVSAFLLFQVQPVIAKIILPWFGGSAAVWTTCMLFFQMVLLLGYLYSHAVTRYVKPRAQVFLHCGLLLLSALALPILPGASWKPMGGEEPTLRIIGLLAVTVGLPYFLLSTTGPLVQAWYARRFKGAMPYRLYALSNAGSMFALLSYPIAFEPVWGTHKQAIMWSVGYAVFILICGYTAFRSGSGPAIEDTVEEGEVEKPTARLYLLWLLLPACASALLLAITNHLSQNVAAIPFLWVLPLSVYLLTFILCFESSGWYKLNPYLQLLAVALGSMAVATFSGGTGIIPIRIGVPLFLMGLFTCCMVCHGELARLKPHPRYLTHFYLMISAGGALGGLLVGLIAPQAFNSYYEMPLALLTCGLLAVVVLRTYEKPAWAKELLPTAQFLIAAVAVMVAGFFAYPLEGSFLKPSYSLMRLFRKGWESTEDFDQGVLFFLLALLCFFMLAVLRGTNLRWMKRGVQWGAFVTELLALMMAGFMGFQTRQSTSGYKVMVRNFYGGMKVRDSGTPAQLDATRSLTHGTINHGEQFLNFTRKRMPTTYYGPNTGIGLAIRELGATRSIRVGVIGLGTGTLASYGRPGDYYRFYEINPQVLQLASTWFTYLGDCPAKHDVAMGDARLSLEREANENFDVLAVDAFSSDSIPVHLLTRESMQLYIRHLSPNGLLAVHISNRYLDLAPVVKGLAQAQGKVTRIVDTEDDEPAGVFGATWVLVASRPEVFTPTILNASTEIVTSRKVRMWTDDYSNLFQILK